MTSTGKGPPPTSLSRRLAAGDRASAPEGRQSGADPVVRCPGPDTHWIEVRLEDEAGQGVANERCTLIDSAGVSHQGKTDARGVLRLDGIPDGPVQVSMTDLDGEAWPEAD